MAWGTPVSPLISLRAALWRTVPLTCEVWANLNVGVRSHCNGPLKNILRKHLAHCTYLSVTFGLGKFNNTEGGNRKTLSWKQDSILGRTVCGLWAICPVSMEMTYQLENQASGRKSPRALHRLKEYPNYLCNWIESWILLCLLGYDHRPIDNCPLLTT